MGHDRFRPNFYISITVNFDPLLPKFCSQNIAKCNKDQFIDTGSVISVSVIFERNVLFPINLS